MGETDKLKITFRNLKPYPYLLPCQSSTFLKTQKQHIYIYNPKAEHAQGQVTAVQMVSFSAQGLVGCNRAEDNSLMEAILCLVAQLCPTLCDPVDCSLPGFSVHGDSPGKNTRAGCHVLLQGTFPIQGLNPGLLPCSQILHHLSYQGSPA